MNAYELEDGTLVGTQADAKASGQPWEKIEIPNTSKPDLIVWLNDRNQTQVVVYEEAPAPEPELTKEDHPWIGRTEQLTKELNVEEAIWAFDLNRCLVLFRVLTHRVQELMGKQS